MYKNLVLYALSVVETTNLQTLDGYKEVIPNSDVDKWIGAMSEKSKSLHKNQM